MPDPLVRLHEIVPVGVVLVPKSVSATVAVQVEGPFTTSGEGVQLMLVVVERLLSVRLKVPELVR